MTINIEFNGSIAVCKVSSYDETTKSFTRNRYFKDCDALTKVMVLDAFHTIEQDYKRTIKNNK